MTRSQTLPEKGNEPLSVWRFSLYWTLQVSLWFTGLHLLFPREMKQELTGGLLKCLALIGMFILSKAGTGLFEHLFHRYVLHTSIIPFLRYFFREHARHHALTDVICFKGKEKTPCPAIDRYAILEPEQNRASFFPYWGLSVFFVSLIPFIAIPQLLFPSIPFVIPGYAAIAFAYAFYEIVHRIEHFSEEWWGVRKSHPRLGKFYTWFHAFHKAHHLDIHCNEGISGFFGIPIWDFLLGTYARLRRPVRAGVTLEKEDFIVPTPRWPIRVLDQFAAWLIRPKTKKIQSLKPAA